MGLIVKIPGLLKPFQPLKPFENCVYLLTSDANSQNKNRSASAHPTYPLGGE
jgi:hypothetical protein